MAGDCLDRARVGRGGSRCRGADGKYGRHRPEISYRRCALRALRFQRRANRSLAALDGCYRSRDSAPAMAQYPHLQQLQALFGGREVRSWAIEMSAATVSRYTPAPADAARKRRHRLWIMLGAAAGIVAAIALCVNGLRYYILSADARFLSPHHAARPPRGTLGNARGIVGGVWLWAPMYLYPLRKKWKWLSKKGKTKNWLDYHILMGLVGPVLITFHSSFKLRGVAGFAYWSMIAVVASGIVGRYLYNRIPRKLDAVE